MVSKDKEGHAFGNLNALNLFNSKVEANVC